MIKGKIEEDINTSCNVTIRNFSGDMLVETITKHNSSTVHLCRFVRDTLLGVSIADQLPGVLVPCKKIGEDTLINLTGDKEIRAYQAKGDPNNEDSRAYVILPFIVPKNSLSVNQEIDGFKLLSFKGDEYASLTLENPIVIKQDTNLEVEWLLEVRPVAK